MIASTDLPSVNLDDPALVQVSVVTSAGVARLTLRALITNWRAKRVVERRDYLLDHAKDDWLNVERALATPLDRVVAQLREFNPVVPQTASTPPPG